MGKYVHVFSEAPLQEDTCGQKEWRNSFVLSILAIDEVLTSAPWPLYHEQKKILWYALDRRLVRLQHRCGVLKEINVFDPAVNRTPISRSCMPQASLYYGWAIATAPAVKCYVLREFKAE